MNTTRRDFLQSSLSALAGLTIVGFVSPTFIGCGDDPASSNTSDAGKTMTVDVSALDANGKAVRTSSPSGRPLIVIRRASDRYVTLLLVCTHQSCSGTDLSNSTVSIICGCHGSTFDLEGNVTAGPATSDLSSFTTTYEAVSKTVTIAF
ncbi:MAG TPA: Rieske (2Fe-2S) protein [Candidatus Kapabacteria bacterium]